MCVEAPQPHITLHAAGVACPAAMRPAAAARASPAWQPAEASAQALPKRIPLRGTKTHVWHSQLDELQHSVLPSLRALAVAGNSIESMPDWSAFPVRGCYCLRARCPCASPADAGVRFPALAEAERGRRCGAGGIAATVTDSHCRHAACSGDGCRAAAHRRSHCRNCALRAACFSARAASDLGAAQLTPLLRFPALEWLDVTGQLLADDAVVRTLPELQGLRWLSLRGNRVTDMQAVLRCVSFCAALRPGG